ncbi:MAG: CHAT domain-containing protein [Variovorax sp.]
MASDLPIVFLAFANAADEHLGLLKAESRDVLAALEPLQKEDLIAIRREESCEFGELYDGLIADGDRLVIFHYGGHADGEQLQFEGGSGGREGLARMLGQQSSLKLVFLNGCASQGHVKLLLDAGVPAVVATSVPIGDQKAQEFATAFYKALADGRSIPDAFETSRGFIEARYPAGNCSRPAFTTQTRQIGGLEKFLGTAPSLEWGLFTREDCGTDIAQWRLRDARALWLVQLADARGPVRGLDGAPLAIEHLLPRRTLPAVVCRVCRTTSTATTDLQTTCAVCGSGDVSMSTVSTGVADQQLAFSIAPEQARAQVLKQLGKAPPADPSSMIRLVPLWVPYWVFDAKTRSTLEAERGRISPAGDAAPALAWESVRDTIVLARDAYLANATAMTLYSDAAGPDWFWTLDQAAALKGLDRTHACLPLDRSMQSAFDDVAASLGNELDAEVVDRIGGVERRNVVTDTRYQELAARTVLLPHWCATVERAETRIDFLVNGATGAVRRLHLHGAIEVQHERTPPVTERTYEPSATPAVPSRAVSVFAGVGIGLMVGMMLGLAAPAGDGRSTVGYFIAAVGAGLAALLGVNDAHFSDAKGLRIGAFGLALVVAAPLGIFIRDHQLLSPGTAAPLSLADRKAEYLALGFQEPEVLEFLKQSIKTDGGAPAADSVRRTVAAVGGIPSALMSGSVLESTQCDALTSPPEQEVAMSTEDVIGNFTLKGGPGWTQLAGQAKELLRGGDQKQFLLMARDSVCGQQSSPTAAQCGKLQAISAGTENDLQRGFAEAGLESLFNRVQSEISASGRVASLRLLASTICKQGKANQ